MDLKAELKILRPDEKAKIKKMSEVVDAELTKHFVPGNKSVRVRRSFLAAAVGGFNRKLLNLLMAQYSEVGWKVREDGDFVVFTC